MKILFFVISVLLLQGCVYYDYKPTNDLDKNYTNNSTGLYEDDDLYIEIIHLSDSVSFNKEHHANVMFYEKSENMQLIIEKVVIKHLYNNSTLKPVKYATKSSRIWYNGYPRHNYYQFYGSKIKWYMKEITERVFVSYILNGKKHTIEKTFILHKSKSHTFCTLIGSV